MRNHFITVVLMVGAALTGCAHKGPITPTTTPALDAQRAALESFDSDRVTAFDGETGEALVWSEIVERAAAADVVMIGEMHGHPEGLATAAALFSDVIALEAHAAALSMEFFERDEQAAIDDYLAGITDEEQFRKATGRTDGNYPPGHREMVETARSAGAPVYGANAPRRYVRLARTDGYETLAGLTFEQRRLFAIPSSLPDGPYKDRFFEVMGGMRGHSDEDAEMTDEERAAKEAEQREMILTFFRSQSVWDATMAETIAWGLDDGRRPIVHVVGQFHSDFEGGTVERLRVLAPDAQILIVSMVDTDAPTMRDEDEGRADILIHVGDD